MSFSSDDPWWPPPTRSHPDDMLVLAIACFLSADPEIAVLPIEITVQDAVAILAGTVCSAELKRRAGFLAWSAPGVRDVSNQLSTPGAG